MVSIQLPWIGDATVEMPSDRLDVGSHAGFRAAKGMGSLSISIVLAEDDSSRP